MSAPANIHALWLRGTHRINAVPVVLMATSGWRIYNAAPFWPLTIPASGKLSHAD